MKIIGSILVFCCLVITACIIYLLKAGVSLHPAPYIKPSAISDDFHNVPKGIFIRLFPDLQKSHYLLWGVTLSTPEEQKTFDLVKDRYEQEFKTTVNLISNPFEVDPEVVKGCAKPCWIIFPEEQAHELAPNAWVQKNITPLEREYISITWIDFIRGQPVPENCLVMKFLDFNCIKTVAVNAVARKMKVKDQRYFFMQKYQDHDFFLFVEKKL